MPVETKSAHNPLRRVAYSLSFAALMAIPACGGALAEGLLGASDEKSILTPCRGEERWGQIRRELKDQGFQWFTDAEAKKEFDRLTCEYNGIVVLFPPNGPHFFEATDRNATVCNISKPVIEVVNELRVQNYPGPWGFQDIRGGYQRAACPEFPPVG